MTQLHDELTSRVTRTFGDQWVTRDGQKIPKADDLKLGNEAVKLDATVLYSDLRDSTQLVLSKKRFFASEIYKAYLYCAGRIIRSEGGSVTAYDGDRIMGVFIGDKPNTEAARCALKINYAVKKIVQPAMEKQYPKETYKVSHTVGIDKSDEIWIARTGVRGDNDLVWVGRAPNYAAKLSEQEGPATWITGAVYSRLLDSSKFGGNPKRDMWTPRTWNGIRVYTSDFRWTV